MKSDRTSRALSFNNSMSELVRRAGVAKTSTIHITGPGGLGPLLWFCRHGYQHVGFVRHDHCPSEPCDILIVLNCSDADALASLLDRGGQIRDGGTIVVQTSSTVSDVQAARVRRLLGQCGYRLEDGPHSHALHVARRVPALMDAA